MDSLLLSLVVFSVQLFVVISVATFADVVCRATDPRLRLAYWRGVALACLGLPLSLLLDAGAAGTDVTLLVASAVSAGPVSVRDVLPAANRVLWPVFCAGALARLGWLCAGGMRLRQLRLHSRRAVLAPHLEAIRSDIAPRAEFRVSSELAQPAGFGLRHPIVLLPRGFFEMDGQAQRTVVCHELLHVARGDWPWIVVEEVARALFWFHPAIWWLVERIQESREQFVDRLVISRIPSKRAYMTALLAFADGGPSTVLATAFLRTRHLRARLRALAKESVMSRGRFIWTAVVLMCVMSGAIATTVMALPFGSPIGGAAASLQAVLDGKDAGVTLPKVITEVKPQYTPEALQARIEGTVTMNAVVGTDGTPRDVEITKSLDAQYGLDKQAMAALRQWRFEPGLKDGKRVAVRVAVEMRFTLKKSTR